MVELITRDSRSLVIVALTLPVVGGVALPGVAVSEPRDEPANTQPPVRVYVSETLDISSVRLSGGGTIGTEETTLTPAGGGESFAVDPTSANFDGVRPGSYYVSRDRDVRADLSVVRPQIYSVVLRNERQQDVTGRQTNPEDLDRMTILARYDFAGADRLDVSVVGPSGNKVASGRITDTGQTLRVDIPDPTPGRYLVTLTGSNIEAGTRTVTVRVRGDVATPTATATETATPTPTPTATRTATPTPTGTTADDGPASASRRHSSRCWQSASWPVDAADQSTERVRSNRYAGSRSSSSSGMCLTL